tara:strand:- start:17 stop:547 length:531 start_codon:yes stop_codon:yes gene_type:complete
MINTKTTQGFLSIVMAVFNGQSSIYHAIMSVIEQNYYDWELLIVNDGSTDKTSEIIKSFTDTRIRYYEQPNMGVSFARNLALSKMSGDYFCFLDADDVMPPGGLRDRLGVFLNQPDLSFVDGKVLYCNENMTFTGKEYVPSFEGFPYHELLCLNRSCYFGNTWMIKKQKDLYLMTI